MNIKSDFVFDKMKSLFKKLWGETYGLEKSYKDRSKWEMYMP